MRSSRGADLVICPGALGDTVLRIVALRLLQRFGEVGENLLLVGSLPYISLAPLFLHDVSVRDYESPPWWELFAPAGPSPRLAEAVAGVRTALVWLPPDERARWNLLKAGIERVDWRSTRRAESDRRHELERLVAYPQSRVQSGLEAEFQNRVAQREPTSLIAIHPGAGSPDKRLPTPVYGTIAERLLELGREVAWILGPAESRDVALFRPPEGVLRLIEPNLVDLVGVLRRAALLVGNDSGVSHLGAALGCPVVAVFTATDPQLWHPVGPDVSVLDIRRKEKPQVIRYRYLEEVSTSARPAEANLVLHILSNAMTLG